MPDLIQLDQILMAEDHSDLGTYYLLLFRKVCSAAKHYKQSYTITLHGLLTETITLCHILAVYLVYFLSNRQVRKFIFYIFTRVGFIDV